MNEVWHTDDRRQGPWETAYDANAREENKAPIKWRSKTCRLAQRRHVDVISWRKIFAKNIDFLQNWGRNTDNDEIKNVFGMNVLTVRSDTLFGESNDTQRRNNENIQQKSQRITDSIKKGPFPSWQESIPFPFNSEKKTRVIQVPLRKLMKRMIKTNNAARDKNDVSRILWQNASPANFEPTARGY